MGEVLRFTGAVEHDPGIDLWLDTRAGELAPLARTWFMALRACGPDVRELLHDGLATACVADVPFGYVGAYARHVSVGFFHGSDLPDPAALLQGGGKRMRHVKLVPGREMPAAELRALIDAAYADVKARLAAD